VVCSRVGLGCPFLLEVCAHCGVWVRGETRNRVERPSRPVLSDFLRYCQSSASRASGAGLIDAYKLLQRMEPRLLPHGDWRTIEVVVLLLYAITTIPAGEAQRLRRRPGAIVPTQVRGEVRARTLGERNLGGGPRKLFADSSPTNQSFSSPRLQLFPSHCKVANLHSTPSIPDHTHQRACYCSIATRKP
jgi:hypothetical protein